MVKFMREILKQFCFDGELKSYKQFGSGHINKTYIADYESDGGIKRYVVQKVNGSVFKNIDELMENVFSVTSYLRDEIKKNGGDPERETLHFIKTKDGKKYYTCSDGSFYRAYVFVRDSISFDSAENSELFKSSGIAFGRFQKMLSSFNADSLFETIPHFHDTKWRYENEFIPAVKEDKAGRVSTCKDEIDFITARESEMSRLFDLARDGKIPLRVTHNDTKLNNVMFDVNTKECVCVIDLDTVMPGIALFDFGDAVRFGANTADEDEKDLNKVGINLEYFKAYAEGFLSEAGDAFNRCEKDNLAFASKLITLELAMRFLTDYINGDVYFNTDYQEHNLVRAKNQLKLVSDMESKMKKMEEIIKAVQ